MEPWQQSHRQHGMKRAHHRSWAVLHARYRWQHCSGALLCLASLALLVATDTAHVPDQAAGGQARPLTGDVIVLAGAALYACANVAQEKLLREHSRLFFSCMAPRSPALVPCSCVPPTCCTCTALQSA